MHFFHLQIPWIVDETEYNCSSRTISEWKARGSINQVQGTYFLTTGTIYMTVYSLSLIGMAKGKLLHIACYRLMFFNGFLDITDIILGSVVISYFHFTGEVFCSNVAVTLFHGHLCLSLWIGSTFICVVLAINRVTEMIPSMHVFRFLFEGRNVYMWMVVSVGIMVLRSFVIRPVLFNSAAGALLITPYISDDGEWELNYYGTLVLPAYNIGFVAMLIILYSVLCFNVFKMKRMREGSVDKAQLLLLLQALVICSFTASFSILYVTVELVQVPPRAVIFLSHIMWQLSHGMHGLVYVLVNSRIRKEVLKLVHLSGRFGRVAQGAESTKSRTDHF